MNNVTRYAVIETALCIGSNLMEGEVFMVMATDHDCELAALREELAEWKARAGRRTAERTEFMNQRDNLQQRLTAAEQRNALMVALLTEHQWEWEPYDSHTHRDGGYYCVECQEPKASGHEAGCKLAAALKPTESGASE